VCVCGFFFTAFSHSLILRLRLGLGLGLRLGLMLGIGLSLSYVTTFQPSLGRSYKTGFTVLSCHHMNGWEHNLVWIDNQNQCTLLI
jgi:hypothetical protein